MMLAFVETAFFHKKTIYCWIFVVNIVKIHKSEADEKCKNQGSIFNDVIVKRFGNYICNLTGKIGKNALIRAGEELRGEKREKSQTTCAKCRGKR